VSQHPQIGFSYACLVRTLTIRRSSGPIALAATLLVAFLLLFAWPQPASAHDSLIDSDPAADSTIEKLPEDLTLTFSAGLIAGEGSTAVVIEDADGNSITDGEPTVDGAMVIQPLVTDAAAGDYTVLWQVVSSDGHPTDGEFSFTLSASADSGDTTTSPEPEATTTEQPVAPIGTEEPSESAPDSSFLSALPWIIGGVLVAGGGGALVAVMMRRARGGDTDSDDPSAR